MNIKSQELYKVKYLKYKQKYFELKGGKSCPNLGFHQHIGECWHDAYSMIMLYTDNLSDNIQYVLENYTKSFETIEELIEDILEFAETNENLEILLPLNIDRSVYHKFKNYSRNYLTNLFQRYSNDKLKLAKDIDIPKKKKVKEMSLVRQASFRESILCTSSVFNILNINNLGEKKLDVVEGGLHETKLYFITSLLNYYLVNYILPNDLKTRTPEELAEIPENYIYNQFVNFDAIFDTKNSPADLISRLKQIKESISNCDSINFGIQSYNPKLSPEGTFISNKQHFRAHMLCMFTCDKKQYFYDNNGVNQYKQKGGENTEVNTGESVQSMQSMQSIADDVAIEQVEKELGKGILNVHDAAEPEEIYKTFTEFNWKQYFSKIIDMIFVEIENNKKLNKPSKEYYGSLRKMMSYFLHKNDKIPSISFPHVGYEKFDIENIQLYKLNKFEKGKTVAEKETTYYTTLIKMFDTWGVLEEYKVDPDRIDSFIESNNVKMLESLFKTEYNREYMRAYLKTIDKTDLLKQLEKKLK